MPKGHARDFIGLYRSIFADIAAYHPTARLGLDRDLSRLKTLSDEAGEKVFTLLLPALGKALDRSLADGRLQVSGLPLARAINTRTKIPRLFQGIWSQLFHHDGCLKASVDPNFVFFLRTILYVGKRTMGSHATRHRKGEDPYPSKLGCSGTAVFAAIKEYYDVEDSLPPASPIWDTGGEFIHLADLGTVGDMVNMDGFGGDLFKQFSPESSLLDLVQLVADRISVLIGDFVPGDVRFKHGPGAVSEGSRGKLYKYDFPTWSGRLQFAFPAEEFAMANSSLLGGGFVASDCVPDEEGASRLIAVPKTQKTPRLIAAEPTCNQWAQQAVRDFLTLRIRSTFIGRSIDFSRQDLSQKLTLTASHTGSYATIDLSSASDRLSCWVVQRIFRRNIPLLTALIASRTRYISNDIDKKSPKLHKLRKFASMGSALTFPVQSLVFFILCVAAGLSLHSGWSISKVARQVRVYGDDIIVPVSWMPRVEHILTRMCLKVNHTKTFSAGNFRESCGMDAWDGHDVTPPYVPEFYSESAPSSLVSIVEVSNNLYKKGLWNASHFVTSSVKDRDLRKVPVLGLEGGGIALLSASGAVFRSRNRWNPDLQQWEALALGLRPRTHTIRSDVSANLLDYFTSREWSEYRQVPHSVDRVAVELGWKAGFPDRPPQVLRHLDPPSEGRVGRVTAVDELLLVHQWVPIWRGK